MARLQVSGHSPMVWYWSGDPMVPRSNPLLVKKFLLLSLLIWKGGFEILPNNTWDLLKKAYGTSKKLRFQFRGQLNKPFSEPTYQYTNLRCWHERMQGNFKPGRMLICSEDIHQLNSCWGGTRSIMDWLRNSCPRSGSIQHRLGRLTTSKWWGHEK